MAQVRLDAVLVGWKEIAQALGISEQTARRIARAEGMPVLRIRRDEQAATGGRIMTTGLALHIWLTVRALGFTRAGWRGMMEGLTQRVRALFTRE